MKILHCIASLKAGGAERQLSYLAPELAKRGHEVHVAFRLSGINLKRLQSSRVILHQLTGHNAYDFSTFWQLLTLIRMLKPDIIQTWIIQMDVLGGLAASLLGKPWVLREPISKLGWPITWKNLLRRWVGLYAPAIIANSQGGSDYWSSLRYKGPCYIIPNVLPLEEIDQISPSNLSEFNLRAEQEIILFAGRMEERQKNLMNLFYAILPLVKSRPIMAILCGDGPDWPKIKELVKKHEVDDKVLLPGVVGNVWSLMKKAAVFISVSRYEGRPNVVLEAMACGCPLVVSDIPAHREILDEDSALFVDPYQPAHITTTIEEILSNPTDAQTRAKRAKTKTLQWSISAIADRYEKLYQEIVMAWQSRK